MTQTGLDSMTWNDWSDAEAADGMACMAEWCCITLHAMPAAFISERV
jgi:hypothetical protein